MPSRALKVSTGVRHPGVDGGSIRSAWRYAHRLVYARGLDLDDRALATPIGMGCKTCERASCPQRAFPAVDRPLAADEHRSTFAPYASGEPERPATQARSIKGPPRASR